jgi:hypothetical protein
MALLERSHSAARTFSTESKNLLKEKLIAEGEDRGSQLPIVVASSPNADIFNVSYVSCYGNELVRKWSEKRYASFKNVFKWGNQLELIKL